MSDIHGKIVERLETRPADPDSGYPRDDALILHFTDGTALEIVGSSYEECSLNSNTLTPSDLLARESKRAEHEAEQAKRAQERADWLALTCEERTARRPTDSAYLMTGSVYHSMALGLLKQQNPFMDEPERTIKHPCTHCGETECPNARTETIPASPGLDWGKTKIIATQP
jgi:hypothetical protein